MHAVAVKHPQALDAKSAADAVAYINAGLAAQRTISAETSLAVRGLVDQMLAADIEAWLAIDQYQALLAHRALLEAQEAAATPDDVDARNQLRLALGRLAWCLEAIAENELTAEAKSSKEIVRWLVESIEVPQKRHCAIAWG